jgi:hypothetical protein
MLFSATLPAWINKVARRYLRTPITVDLVGEHNTGKLAESIRCGPGPLRRVDRAAGHTADYMAAAAHLLPAAG